MTAQYRLRDTFDRDPLRFVLAYFATSEEFRKLAAAGVVVIAEYPSYDEFCKSTLQEMPKLTAEPTSSPRAFLRIVAGKTDLYWLSFSIENEPGSTKKHKTSDGDDL